MITLKNLTAKNFLSIGNQTQAVNFCNNQVTLVLGENLDLGDTGHKNGTGKSAIINALSFALYGQALTNIKKDNLINKINKKNMLVTLTFQKDSTEYHIERGRKPNVFKLFVNGKVQDSVEDESQGDMRETQKDLTDIIGMSHDMFKNIVALNTYSEPFLSMRASDQRVIIEQLLGITLLSEKAELLKEQVKQTSDTIQQETANIEATKKSNENIQKSINTLTIKKETWDTQQVSEIEALDKSIKELSTVNIEGEIKKHGELEKIQKALLTESGLKSNRTSLVVTLTRLEKELRVLEKEQLQLTEMTCPACEQKLHNDIHTSLINKNKQKIETLFTELNETKEQIEIIDTKIQKNTVYGDIPDTFYKKLADALQHRHTLDSLTETLQNKRREINPYREQIEELQKTAIQELKWDYLNQLTALRDHQQFLLKLLTNKDSFIRKKIIDQNLAYLNNRLTTYLDTIGLPHTVLFKNDLTVEISELGQELDFDNLSRGERTRLILGLAFAFRDVWENLYHGINLLFIDELIDNGLDSAGVEQTLSILKRMGRERNKNIYLISHRDELLGRVNNVLRVIKERGFTSYETSEEVMEEK